MLPDELDLSTLDFSLHDSGGCAFRKIEATLYLTNFLQKLC